MENEPKIHIDRRFLGDQNLKFEGEQYKGMPVLDTRVTILEGTVCWISWKDREAFVKELNATIEKYRI